MPLLLGFMAICLSGLAVPVCAQVRIQDSGDLVGLVGADGVWAQRDPRWHREVVLKGHEGHTYLARRIRVDTGEVAYGFVYSHCLDSSHEAGPHPPFSSDLRMDEPVLQNWDSAHCFFDVAADQGSLCHSRAGFSTFGANEETGGVEVRWDNYSATTCVRFTAQAQEARLAVDVKVLPKVKTDCLSLYLRCYPNAYAGGNAGAALRRRRILTPNRDVAATSNSLQTIVLQKEEPWVVYYDVNFDKDQSHAVSEGARWTGAGPCALAYDVRQTTQAVVRLANYHIDTVLSYPPAVREMNLMLWDFGAGPGAKNNRDALNYFKSLKIRKETP
ncbi:MAG: hypothetical protein PHR35_10870 [Kiritimatiellae bacterium]|nr:hypothetical protein [Kiritimatiellia bacterium]